jgi:EmrB/QacA subfamily drug resistance transporter
MSRAPVRLSRTPSAASRNRWTLVAATLGLGITILDETVVFLALPAIDRDLDIGLAGQQWVVNGYLLPLAALLLVAGSLADRYGRRRLFVLGLVGFGVASLAAGLAPSGELLIVARVVQGTFAAVLMPSTLALLVATFRDEERAGAIGTWAAWGGAAAAVGPLVAGVLIAIASWRWVFFLSLPIVAVAIGLALWAVPESTADRARQDRPDVLGALLATLAVGAGSYVVVQGPAVGWTDPAVLAGALIAPVAVGAFLLQERRSSAPMLPLGLFRSRDFTAANASTVALYAVFNGNFFLLTIYLQTAVGYSALQAGAATLPLTLLMLALAERFGRLGERRGPRPLMVTGQLLAAAGLLLLSFLTPGDDYFREVLPGVVLFGTGLAITVAPLTNTAVSAVGDEQVGLASGVNNAAARLAGLLGVAVIGLVFAVVFRSDLPASTPSVQPAALEQARQSPTSALDLSLEPPDRATVEAASVRGYRLGMWTGSGLAAVGALIAFVGVGTAPARRDRIPRPAAQPDQRGSSSA